MQEFKKLNRDSWETAEASVLTRELDKPKTGASDISTREAPKVANVKTESLQELRYVRIRGGRILRECLPEKERN